MDTEQSGLNIPGSDKYIKPGDIVILGRFSTYRWIVKFGWFSFGGNRKICGWYVEGESDNTTIKPIQDIDLYDIYFVESA